MAYELWSQDVFSKGELSPYMYGRATVNQYLEGLKTAQNVLTYPTGAAGKRFGTLYQATLSGLTSFSQLYFETFQYLNETVYQLVFTPLNVAIYLEGILQANVTTVFVDYQVYNMSTTVLGAIFRVATLLVAPYDLTRSPNSPIAITGFGTNFLTMASASLTVGQVLPVKFTTSGSLPTTVPQIIAGVTYFINPLSATTFEVYANSYDAKFRNPFTRFTINSAGTSSNTVIQNTWAINLTKFKNVPVYDFNSATTSYDALTFTPSAVNGAAVTVTVSGGGYAPLDSSYVGGAFIGGGGTGRITAVASVTSFTIAVQTPFDSTSAILGSLAFLAEPAWSNLRGWPQVCSSYQNRACFANTVSLPNGFWASTINGYSDFGDLTGDDDDAISWYPSSNNVNFIRFIVPYRSLTVHTNTGIYSSPLSDISAITPSNFTLQLQDSTPADVLLPQAIDNQVVVLSGDDAHQMIWDGINNAYTSDIVSVISEQTIRNPVDETPFADLRRAGSRYIFIINANGSMAIFQTLISQNVSGFTPQVMDQTYGNASFIQSASSSDGRAWFVVSRDIASPLSPIAITGFTPGATSTLTVTGSNLQALGPVPITFTTTGSLPTSIPQVVINQYYWAVGIDANTIAVYLDQADALADVNRIEFSNAGTSSNVIISLLQTIFTLEELTQDTYLDCAVYFNNNGTPVDTITTGALFNAQNVKMVGDGFGFEATGINNQVVFEAHGVSTPVNEGYIGFPIITIMEPMPLTISNGNSAKNTTLTKPKHIHNVRFMFNQTIGGTINGVPIALNRFNQANIGEPPIPAMGVFEMSIMKGWDDFNNPSYTIYHDDPFNIELLGVFYSVEI
jgi:hypothetical protein